MIPRPLPSIRKKSILETAMPASVPVLLTVLLKTAFLQGAPDQKQDPPDELKDLKEQVKTLERALQEARLQVEKLAERIRKLEEENRILQKNQLEEARSLLLLRQLNRNLKEENSRLRDQLRRLRTNAAKNEVAVPAIGPEYPMMGYVIAVGRDYGFVMATIEQKHPDDEIKSGYVFQILRGEQLIAKGEVTRVIPPNEISKNPKVHIRITHGNVSDVKEGDRVVAQRKVTVQKKPPVQPDAQDQPARITGVIGDENKLFVLNKGRLHGLRLKDRVFVYRDDRLIGVLELTLVKNDQSIGELIPGSKIREIRKGDEIRFEKQDVRPRDVIGQILYADREIVLDVGTKHGARPGQKYEVRRDGKRIGYVTIRDALYDMSYAEPADGTRKEDLKKKDVVELIKD